MIAFDARRGIALLVATLCAAPGSSQSPESTIAIKVTDISADVTLIGRLGKPLGTMLNVTGTWGFPDQSNGPTKDYSLRFSVTHVDGSRLSRPVILRVGAVHVTDHNGTDLIPDRDEHAMLDGNRWTLRVYETGRFTDVPAEYWEVRGHPAMIPEPAFASQIVGYPVANPKGRTKR